MQQESDPRVEIRRETPSYDGSLAPSRSMETPTAPDLKHVPHELVEAGAAGRLAVLVGAGANLGSRLPSWKMLG